MAARLKWPQGESAPSKYCLSTLPAGYGARNPRCNRQPAPAARARPGEAFTTTGPLCVAAYGFLVFGKESDSPLDVELVIKAPAYPLVCDPVNPPIPAQRHVKSSIAIIRIS
jgi:hypothetical protein